MPPASKQAEWIAGIDFGPDDSYIIVTTNSDILMNSGLPAI